MEEVTLTAGLSDREGVQVMHPTIYLYPEISLTTEENHEKPPGLTFSAT
jgi:hypothetical protein